MALWRCGAVVRWCCGATLQCYRATPLRCGAAVQRCGATVLRARVDLSETLLAGQCTESLADRVIVWHGLHGHLLATHLEELVKLTRHILTDRLDRRLKLHLLCFLWLHDP